MPDIHYVYAAVTTHKHKHNKPQTFSCDNTLTNVPHTFFWSHTARLRPSYTAYLKQTRKSIYYTLMTTKIV